MPPGGAKNRKHAKMCDCDLCSSSVAWLTNTAFRTARCADIASGIARICVLVMSTASLYYQATRRSCSSTTSKERPHYITGSVQPRCAVLRTITLRNWKKRCQIIGFQTKTGFDWVTGFLKRHREIALRTPEATSLRHAMGFNRANVALFNDNLDRLYLRDSLTPARIWNLDETGCTLVQKPSRIIGSTEVKQVGAVVSAERGQLVTICCAVSAIGNMVPPMCIFPRMRYRDPYVTGAPPNSISAAHPSGWMTAENFLTFRKHFVRHVRYSQAETVLLILNNHDSHQSIEVLEFAKENGVVMLPSPCTHLTNCSRSIGLFTDR